jgi:hypothetical protein
LCKSVQSVAKQRRQRIGEMNEWETAVAVVNGKWLLGKRPSQSA